MSVRLLFKNIYLLRKIMFLKWTRTVYSDKRELFSASHDARRNVNVDTGTDHQRSTILMRFNLKKIYFGRKLAVKRHD